MHILVDMRLFKVLLSLQVLLLSLATPTKVFAQKPVELTNKGYADLTQLETIFSNVLNIITILAGFSALLMLTLGAFRYIVAQGDPKAVAAARSTITCAIAGLIFLVVAWLIILFVETFTGVNVTQFKINLPE